MDFLIIIDQVETVVELGVVPKRGVDAKQR